jgi:hypothetical protein
LNFDLKALKATDVNYKVDMPGLEWKGTSGREDYQDKKIKEWKVKDHYQKENIK